MSHFYERVLNKTVNYFGELGKLIHIFEEEGIQTSLYYNPISLARYIDASCFRKLDISTNFLSLFDLLKDIKREAPRDGFIEYSEMILSLAVQIKNDYYGTHTERDNASEKFNDLIKIIKIDLEKLDLKCEFIESAAGKVVIIIPKDELLESVLDDITDDNISRKLIEYKSIKMEGNIDGKESLLCAFGKYIEPLLKDNQLEQMNSRLFSDVSFMLNNLDLRHNNSNANVQKFYKSTLNQREEWLDRLYTEILLVIKTVFERSAHNSVTNLKKI